MVRFENRLFVMLLTLALAAGPGAAFAQSAPSGIPSYAVPPPAAAPADNRETIHGQVASFDPNPGNLQLNDDRGFVDTVQLQQNTVVRPPDAQFQPGMVLT